jgi:phosphoserine phosphatase
VTGRPSPDRHDGFAAVVFDCDSTLAAIEGIDELAVHHAEEVRALTAAAMEGTIPVQAVYGSRLEKIRPTRAQLDALGEAYVAALVPDARETVAALLSLGKTVRVVSGGLRPAVVAAARALGLSGDDVFAVDIHFDAAGEYAGFESDSPLTRNGGKEEVLRAAALPRPTLLVGDGVTDAEARPAVDAFAAYMGVVHRPPVAAAADFVLPDASLSAVLALACSADDRARLAAGPFAALLERGDALLRRAGAHPIGRVD